MVLVSLLSVAAVTWLFRVAFIALVDAGRLPAFVRARMDAVGPAAFAALIASKLAGTPADTALPVAAALAVAAFTASRTRNHIVAIGAAVGAWLLASAF